MPTAVRRRGRPADPELRVRRESEILDAAAHAFAEHGFAGLDVDVLAARLGVGKGTIYRYFPTKEALFLAAIDRRIVEMTHALDERTRGVTAPLARVETALRAYLEHFDAHPELVDLMMIERGVFRDRRQHTYFRHRDANLREWEETFRTLISEGVVRDVPIARILDVVGSAIYGAVFTHHFTGRRRKLAAQADDILDVILRGILARPASAPRRKR